MTPQVGTKSGLSWDQVLVMRNLLTERSISEAMAVLKRGNRTKFWDQVLGPLLTARLVEMTNPEKPRSSKQRYRLTHAGRALTEMLAPGNRGKPEG